jgi:hypothetical protein
MKDYVKIANELGNLVKEKQEAYGDSFSKSSQIIKILYPDGISPENYGDLLTITRIIDKLFRIATDKDALGESPYRDIAGYALLGLANDLEENKAAEREIRALQPVEKIKKR